MKKLILVLLFYIILPLIFVELFLRWFNPIYFCNTVSQFRYDKALGVITRPNLEKSILTDHIVEIFTNDIGSRNYLNKADLLKYKKIVFCVGDSYTEGVGNLTDQSYPFYLDLLLNRDKNSGIYEKKFAVINLGVGGYGSIQSYRSVKSYMKSIGRMPDAIIYLICENDFEDDDAFRSGFKHRHAVSGSPYYNHTLVALNEIFEKTQLCRRFKLLVSPVVHRKTYLLKSRPSQNQLDNKKFEPKDLSGLIDLINFSRDNHIKLIISYTDYISSQHDLFKRFANENKILFANYKPDIESLTTAIPKLPVLNRHSGQHYRSWVSYIIASKFSTFFEDGENN